uniref:Protein-lysine N-methyltransferase n=1 Tax=Rhabditophanes sp. KR3021 TaxID=114890 RepID=A0AC35TJB1_9BILA
MESDDETPQLSAASLQALQEFLKEQITEVPPENEPVPENWKLSQFWYSDDTATQLVGEAMEALKGIKKPRIALVSSPTLMRFFRSRPEFEAGAFSVHLFEFDRRFGEQFGDNFSFYDFNSPTAIDDSLKHTFDFIIADPPYLASDVLTAVSESVKLLMKEGNSKIILCTGAVMEKTAFETLHLKRTSFAPKHANNLSNDFCCFANYITHHL